MKASALQGLFRFDFSSWLESCPLRYLLLAGVVALHPSVR